MSYLLHPRGIGVSDHPAEAFSYGLAKHNELVRAFEPFISKCFSDDEAWASLFSDQSRLTTFRHIYGNRPGKRKKTSRPPPAQLF